MPELVDVEGFRRVLAEHAAGRRVVDVDVRDSGVPAAEFARRLRSRRRKLKPALMDQSLVAGLGNLLVDEILWRSRLHPQRDQDGARCPRCATVLEHARVGGRGTVWCPSCQLAP